MPKKQMKFKGGGKIKRFVEGTEVEGRDIYADARARDDSPELFNERMKSSVRRAISPPDEVGDYFSKSDNPALKLMGEQRKRPNDNDAVLRALRGETSSLEDQGYGFKQLPPSVAKARAKAAKAVSNQATSSASSSQSRPADVTSQIPGQSLTAEQREGIDRGKRVTGTELGRNVSNTMNALTPLGGGVLKVGTELAMGNRAKQAVQAAQAEGKLNAAGQRAKNSLDLKRVAEPGMDAAKVNPNYWVAGSQQGQKIVAAESKAVQAETKAAQAAARKKAAQAKKDAKDPVMNARPGADKAKPGDYAYESDVAMSPMYGYKKGGAVKKFAKGGSVSSASSRGDGIAIRGKTKGTISKMCGGGMYKGKK